MAITQSKNNYLTDLVPGDKVVEYNKLTTERLISEVTAINDEFITVERADGTVVRYGTSDGRIIVPYGTVIPYMYLLKYVPINAPTPFNPGPVSSDAEELLGNDDNLKK